MKAHPNQKFAEDSFAAIVSQIPLVSHQQTNLGELEKRIESFLKGKAPYQMIAVPLELVETDENIRLADDELSDPEFKNLVASIQKVGVIQPATLRVIETSDGLRFKCVAGHRRIRAAKIAVPSLSSMNFLVRKFENDNLQLITTVIENTHRKSLHPFDLGKSVRRLVSQGMTFAELELLFERDQWNLRRFDKMNDWNEISRTLVLENQKRFTSTFLLHLASKSLTPQQVEVEIRKKLGLAEGVPRRIKLSDRVKAYALQNQLSVDQLSLIQKVMQDLGLMGTETKRGGGRRKGATTSANRSEDLAAEDHLSRIK